MTHFQKLHIDAVIRQMMSGFDINQQAPNGVSILHKAVRINDLNLVTFLLERGACAQAQTRRGHTPLDWAEALGYTECAQLLINAMDRRESAKNEENASYLGQQRSLKSTQRR